MSRSPWEPGFVAPIAREIISRTWPQRREARTTRFHVRACDARLASPSRPPHPRLTCRDDRDTSLRIEAGWPDHTSDFRYA